MFVQIDHDTLVSGGNSVNYVSVTYTKHHVSIITDIWNVWDNLLELSVSAVIVYTMMHLLLIYSPVKDKNLPVASFLYMLYKSA